MRPGQTVDVAGYTLLFEGISRASGPNYREDRAQFLVSRGGGSPFPLTPTKRYFETRQMATTEAAIETAAFSQLYVSLGDQADDGSIAVRASYRPLVTLIWLGRAGHGVRRRAVALRPALPHRRAAPRAARSRAAAPA